MAPGSKLPLRCAIYTRKSSEEGLDQDFNSLHAQREACEAYILSQRHEGWQSIAETYDDGGYSGGSMDRPDLQRLIADIEAGEIDIIVVYKVDRLTRSLMDFSKIIEIFDRNGTSFVSVTQQFSTTTSMGRLTLNMLLSFVQFEREVTGERIRDKIAASKKKGLWMGGYVPLGYEPNGRTLSVNEKEAKTVRALFEIYDQLGSVREVKSEADRLGLRTKSRHRADGRITGNLPFRRGHLYQFLANPIYAGKISHKGNLYDAKHPAIIDALLWDRVQAKLCSKKSPYTQKAFEANLLIGLVYDDAGRRMSPISTKKKNRRYRYYENRQPIVDGSKLRLRIPAADLERAVIQLLQEFLLDKPRLLERLGQSLNTPPPALLANAETLAHSLSVAPICDLIDLVRQLVLRVVVGRTRLELSISVAALSTLLKQSCGETSDLKPIKLEKPVSFPRKEGQMRLVIHAPSQPVTADPSPSLTRALLRARDWYDRASAGETIKELAKTERLATSYISRTLRLAFLAPALVNDILEGRFVPGIGTADLLNRSAALPLAWHEQRAFLSSAPD